jgi:hypothetical protein
VGKIRSVLMLQQVVHIDTIGIQGFKLFPYYRIQEAFARLRGYIFD